MFGCKKCRPGTNAAPNQANVELWTNISGLSTAKSSENRAAPHRRADCHKMTTSLEFIAFGILWGMASTDTNLRG